MEWQTVNNEDRSMTTRASRSTLINIKTRKAPSETEINSDFYKYAGKLHAFLYRLLKLFNTKLKQVRYQRTGKKYSTELQKNKFFNTYYNIFIIIIIISSTALCESRLPYNIFSKIINDKLKQYSEAFLLEKQITLEQVMFVQIQIFV
jgi:hypothetical protein